MNAWLFNKLLNNFFSILYVKFNLKVARVGLFGE